MKYETRRLYREDRDKQQMEAAFTEDGKGLNIDTKI